MPNSTLRFHKRRTTQSPLRSEKDGPQNPPARRPADVPTSRLPALISAWIDDGEWRGHSPATRSLHREIADNLLWFLRDRQSDTCGTDELRAFLTDLRTSHTEEDGLWHGVDAPPGRWGNLQATRKVCPSTVHTYHTRLKTF